MFDLSAAIAAIPGIRHYPSVGDLRRLAEDLRSDERFSVAVAGVSPGGRPVHHLRFGNGAFKVLIFGFPHPNEPVGGATITSLVNMLRQDASPLAALDVAWHIVPCIDPDGASLNEGWFLAPFDIRLQMRNFHRPEINAQVESSFPIDYKRLRFGDPAPEALMLRSLLDGIRPDFYYALHNAAAGGGIWYLLDRALSSRQYEQLTELAARHDLPMRRNPPFEGYSERFHPGIIEDFRTRKCYDFLETTMDHPEAVMPYGETASEYLKRINPQAFTLVTEVCSFKHPHDDSSRPTGQNLRHCKLRTYANLKYVATVILEEWDRVGTRLDSQSPFYAKIWGGLISVRQFLAEGLPAWPDKTRSLLYSPIHNRMMTEGDRVNVWLTEYFLLCQNYAFVRLLREVAGDAEIDGAIARLDHVFDLLLAEIEAEIDAGLLEAVPVEDLVKVQLGAGFVVLDALLSQRAR